MLNKLLRWAKITKPSTDDQQFPVQQVTAMGKVADALMVFPYGIHGNVPADALALMFAVQGNIDNRAVIAWTPKDRPKLAAGEVAFYHPPTDAFIIWRSNGDLDIETAADVNLKCKDATVDASGSVTINTPTWTLNGNMVVNGTMTNNGKDVGDTHGHTQAADSDGDSEAPINGVT
jgi:phage gp45-like